MTFDPVALSTTTPVDVVASLSLATGRSYGAQYQGPGALALRESVTGTTPDLDDAKSYATASDPLRLTPKSGEGIWAWVILAGSARLATDAQIVVWEE